MYSRTQAIATLDDLRNFVSEILSSNGQLLNGAFPVTERILMRGNRPCGMYFCLHGPRRVKITAIWETDTNAVLFYGADGQRFHKAQLTQAPELMPAAA